MKEFIINGEIGYKKLEEIKDPSFYKVFGDLAAKAKQVKTIQVLKQEVVAYYHLDYGKDSHDNCLFLNTLKNDEMRFITKDSLNHAKNIAKLYIKDFLTFIASVKFRDKDSQVIVCRVPRSKTPNSNLPDYFLFEEAVSEAVDEDESGKFINGVDYIKRHTDVKTHHLARRENSKPKIENTGSDTYPGITLDTCDISDNIKDNDIILIDDVYTAPDKYHEYQKTNLNVCEDCIHALYDKGAKQVIFYAVARTMKKTNSPSTDLTKE